MQMIPEKWIDQAAGPVARSYSTWVTLADIKQTLWTWVYANTGKIEEYGAHQDGERIIRSILAQEGRNYANRERAKMSGYEYDDVAWYTITALKRILPDVFDYMDWQSFEMKSDGPSNRPAAWSGDKLATLIDVKRAMESLPQQRQDLLRAHYAEGVILEKLGDHMGIKTDTAKKQLQRALKAMSKFLNEPRVADPMEGATHEQWQANQRFYDTRTKGRRAISNAAARKRTDGSYGD